MSNNSSRATAIDSFIEQNQPPTHARLIFALDATASREETWDLAQKLQAQMFAATATMGALDVQLIYFRGGLDHIPDEPNRAECRASPWLSNPAALTTMMRKIDCRAGLTQIGRVLTHAKAQAENQPVQALIFVGDAMEEKIERLTATATELGDLKTPVFMFQEGDTPGVARAYKLIAMASGGAYFKFNEGSAAQLSDLLRAVAVFAVGGIKALEGQGETARLLLEQLKP
jgi:hypothetical protein